MAKKKKIIPKIERIKFVDYSILCPSDFIFYNHQSKETAITADVILTSEDYFNYYDPITRKEILVKRVNESLKIIKYHEYFVLNLGGTYISYAMVYYRKDSQFIGTDKENKFSYARNIIIIPTFDAFLYVNFKNVSMLVAKDLESILTKATKDWGQAMSDKELMIFHTSSEYRNLISTLLHFYSDVYDEEGKSRNLARPETIGIYRSFDPNRGIILHSNDLKLDLLELFGSTLKESFDFESIIKLDNVTELDLEKIKNKKENT